MKGLVQKGHGRGNMIQTCIRAPAGVSLYSLRRGI